MAEVQTSHLRREILEQPKVLTRLLERERANVERLVQKWRKQEVHYVTIAARGSSDNAAIYGKYLFGAVNGLPVALAAPSLYTLYGARPNLAHSLVIAISQSGESTDILAVVEEARRQGCPTLAITNRAESALAKTADDTILLHAGEEKSIAATKTYTASVAALALLAATWHQVNSPELDELLALPEKMAEAMQLEGETRRLAEQMVALKYCVVIGRGFNYGTAFEIALKLKELAYVNAEPYSSADFLHGPVALVDKDLYVLVLAPGGRVYPHVLDFTKRIRNEGARVIAISEQEEIRQLAAVGLQLPRGVPEWLSPLVAVVPGQLLSLYLAAAKGYDVDQPRGLSKVTRTW